MKIIPENFFMLRNVFFIFIATLGLFSCGDSNNKEDILVSIGDENLTLNDVSDLLPSDISEEDSILYSEKIINTWINNQLILQVASLELPNMNEIDRLTELYRAQLISYEYRKRIILNENLKFSIPNDSLLDYYNKNQGKFELKAPIVKGVYIKVSEESPKLDDVRKWIKSNDSEDLEQLENFGIKDAIAYDYFRDKWISWTLIEKNIPYDFSNANDFVKTHKTFEISKNGFVYLLNISDYRLKGSVMPFELAKDNIKEIYLNANQFRIDEEIKQQLYDDALESGKLKIRYKEKN